MSSKEKMIRVCLVVPSSVWRRSISVAADRGITRAEFVRRVLAAALESKGPTTAPPPQVPHHLAVPDDDRFLMPGMRAAPTAPAPAAQKPPQKTPRELELEKRNYFRGFAEFAAADDGRLGRGDRGGSAP